MNKHDELLQKNAAMYLNPPEPSWMDLTLILVFFLVPFGFLSFGLIHAGQHFALILAGVFVTASLLRNRWLATFLVYAGLWMGFIFIVKMINPKMPDVIVMSGLSSVTFLMIAGILMVAVERLPVETKTMLDAVRAMAIIQGLVAVCQYLGFDPLLWVLQQAFPAKSLMGDGEISGTLGNSNFLCAYMAITLPLFLRGKWKLFLPLCIALLVVSKSSTAVVSAVVALCIYYRRKEVLIFGLAAGVLYALLDANFFTNTRWEYWETAWNQITSGPFVLIFGHGIGAGWGQPFPLHNEWLQVWHQFGLVGFIILACYALSVWNLYDYTRYCSLFANITDEQKQNTRVLFACLMAVFVNCLGNYPLHLAPSSFLIVVLAGLYERERWLIT